MPKEEIRVKDEALIVPAKSGCVIVDGVKEKRKELYKLAETLKSDYVIVGYDNPIDDWRYVRRLQPDMVVLDEASAIKGFASKRSKFFKEYLMSPYRLALTATPLRTGDQKKCSQSWSGLILTCSAGTIFSTKRS